MVSTLPGNFFLPHYDGYTGLEYDSRGIDSIKSNSNTVFILRNNCPETSAALLI